MNHFKSLFSTVAAISLFAMMALTFADVVGRKFFNNSLTGAVELTEIFMTLMIFFSLPLASLASEHIVFDLLDRMLPSAMLHLQRTLSHVLTGLIFLGAAYIVFERAVRTMEYGDVTATLEIRMGPFHYLIAVMLLITALIHGWMAWRDGRRIGSPA